MSCIHGGDKMEENIFSFNNIFSNSKEQSRERKREYEHFQPLDIFAKFYTRAHVLVTTTK